jgi:hypothetical protein
MIARAWLRAVKQPYIYRRLRSCSSFLELKVTSV